MIYNKLGATDIVVSKMCYGSLTLGPLQANLPIDKGSELIVKAYEMGVNFIDTAQLYQTYPYIKEALKSINRSNYVISSKSYAYDIKTAKETFEEALRELNTDYIDIFMLHEQESEHTVRGHYEALEYFSKMKKEGYIRAIGISTHFVEGVKAANKYRDIIEVIHPIFNISGLGIQDGNIEDMERELKTFKSSGGGVFGMKPLGGGNLLHSIDDCFEFVLNNELIDSFAIGMQSVDEIVSNVCRVTDKPVPSEVIERLKDKKRQLIVADWCTGCGKCEFRCKNQGITVIDSKAIPNEKCVLCGYCSAVCPDFCIKVI